MNISKSLKTIGTAIAVVAMLGLAGSLLGSSSVVQAVAISSSNTLRKTILSG